jgi:hypothetical protein
VKDGVTRVLDASATADALGLTKVFDVMVSQIVTDASTGSILTSSEYADLPGFEPRVAWSEGTPA